MSRRGKYIRRYFNWKYSIPENVARGDVTRTKVVLVLITKGGMVRRVRKDGRRVDVMRNGRTNVRRRGGRERRAHRFNIAAGFSPATKEGNAISYVSHSQYLIHILVPALS